MKTKTIYICDCGGFCGKEFEDYEQATKHEAMHRFPFEAEIQDGHNHWHLCNDRLYPRYITVTFDDGSTANYEFDVYMNPGAGE